MKLKIKKISLELSNFEADNLEEELQGLIYGLGKHKERKKEYPNLDKLREFLLKNKSGFTD